MPWSPETRLADAIALEAAGRDDDARRAYLATLIALPDDAVTLNRLGSLLCRTGYRGAARTAFARAAACHPEQPQAHVNLGHLLREDGDLAGARRHYAAALRACPGLPEAHQGLGNVLFDEGDAAAAEQHWRTGYRDREFSSWPYRGREPPVRVLLLASVRGGNIPAHPLLDTTVFAVTTVAMEFYSPSLPLPPHDVVLNAIGDADLCRPALLAAEALLSCTAAPVVNRPAAVLATTRHANAGRLAAVPGVVAPRVHRFGRAALLAPGALAERGFRFPLLLRAPGFHTGKHFLRIDAEDDLAAGIEALPGDDLLAIEYIAPHGADGQFRKYRVMCVGGVPYPLHLAISRDWKVHYFTAAMAENAAYRAEEAQFLADMPAVLGARAVAALAGIFAVLGLDYAGVDFCVAPDGSVVLFEANATMAIVPPTGDAMWDYRRDPIARVVQATARLVRERAAASVA